jgi:di/tricarboxylate transporter
MGQELALTTDMLWVLGVLGLTITLFILEVFRVDVIAITIMVLLGFLGLVPGEHLFDGFASNAVMSITAVMILGAALDRTGAMSRVSLQILKWSGSAERRLTYLICLSVGAISSVMQNVGAAALFLPVVTRIAARARVAPSKLMLPMGFCAILGGTITMIGSSPMIVLNELIQNANRTLPQGAATMTPFSMFSVAPIGIPILIAGILYLVFLGRHWLPRLQEASSGGLRHTHAYFADAYGIDGEVFELLVTADSELVGQTVGEVERHAGAPLLLALKNSDEARLAPPADEMIWVGSVIGFMGPREEIEAFATRFELKVLPGLRNFGDLFNAARAGISEVVIGPGSRFLGRSAADLRLRKSYGLSVLALNRAGEIFREDSRQVPLQVGDCLVVHSRWQDLLPLASERDLMVASDLPINDAEPKRVLLAVGLFVGALLLVMLTDLKLAVCLLAGAIGTVLAGILTMDDAYKAVNWKSVFLLASLISLGYAMETTGTAAWIAQEILGLVGEVEPWVLQIVIALLGTFFTLVMSNVGACVLLVPLAINLALAAGADPKQFALIAALATCNAFILPTDQVNSLVMGPGGYRVLDYVKVGGGMSVVYLTVMLGSVNLVWWLQTLIAR